MGLIDSIKGFIDPFRLEARSGAPFTVAGEYPDWQTQMSTMTGWRRAHGGAWRLPSIEEALGVPSILRCVTLISNTTGQLTVVGYRDGTQMADSPRIVTRPDPWTTPQVFYRDSAYNMATRGEVVWYIASFDGDGLASALVVVPLRELTIEQNPRDRLRPEYTWGTGTGSVTSTRWSPANPAGRFVHVTYLAEPGDLRGRGPLQLAQAAVSVSVESQQWAANFYAKGGYPSVMLHSDDELEDMDAQSLKEQWANSPPNTPLVTSGGLNVTEFGVNPQGAQMLDARSHQDGEGARMFGVPGTLVEFNAPGSSLTYQNIGEVFTLFVKSCLAPNYLEPMEQALSDLLPRSTVARFYVEGFYRADMRTRWEVYEIATKVIGVDEAAQWAREREGLAPGDVEYKPVLFAPPAAVPARLPSARTAVADAKELEVRCDGMVSRRNGGVPSLVRCNRLLARNGVLPDFCPRCKKQFAVA